MGRPGRTGTEFPEDCDCQVLAEFVDLGSMPATIDGMKFPVGGGAETVARVRILFLGVLPKIASAALAAMMAQSGRLRRVGKDILCG